MTVNRHRSIERVKQSFHRSEHEMEWNGYGGDLEKESKTSHKRKNADSWRGGTEKKTMAADKSWNAPRLWRNTEASRKRILRPDEAEKPTTRNALELKPHASIGVKYASAMAVEKLIL